MTKPAEILLPQTSTQAQALVLELRGRRAGLNEAIEGAAARRKANAALAALGNASAQAELERAETDERQARAALARLDEATSAMERHTDALLRAEREARAKADADRLERGIGELLDLDDTIDEHCMEVRQLLQRRRELLAGGLESAGNFGLGIGAARAVGQALLAYFDQEFWFLRERLSYQELHTVAEHDSQAFGRSSPRSTVRGPREHTITERALQRAFERPPAFQGNGGFDSQTKNDKFHAKGGRKAVNDSSAGCPTIQTGSHR